MKTFTANDARSNFSELMDISRREPIAITKHGRIVNVLLAREDYERFARIEDEWWMSYNATGIVSEVDNLNIELAKKEVEDGKFVKGNLIQ